MENTSSFDELEAVATLAATAALRCESESGLGVASNPCRDSATSPVPSANVSPRWRGAIRREHANNSKDVEKEIGIASTPSLLLQQNPSETAPDQRATPTTARLRTRESTTLQKVETMTC